MDEATIFIVCGYIRQAQAVLRSEYIPYHHIPESITKIIVAYLRNYFINKGMHIWKVNDTLTVKKMLTAKNLQKFESTEFTMAKCKWKLEVYPNGNNKELQNFFTIHLRLLSLPSMIESITFGRTFRIIETMASAPWTETIKAMEYEYWTRKCPLSELLQTQTLSIQIEVHIFAIKLKKDYKLSELNLGKYGFESLIPSTKTLFPFKQRFEYSLDQNAMDIFRKCAKYKCMCSAIINDMWVFTLYPRGNRAVNGYDHCSAIYLRLVVWPNNISELKTKFTLTCVERHDSIEYEHIFNASASSYGTHAWDEWINLKDFKTLTFAVEIEILSSQSVKDESIVEDRHQISYLLTS